MRRVFTAGILTTSCCVLLLAQPVSAQQVPATATSEASQAQSQQGPLVLEPVHNGFVIAPDAKVTRMDSVTRTLVGAYGGWLAEDTLLVGAGGYWLANGSRDQGMAYGGFVIGWTMPAAGRIRFGVRGLVGGGQATLARNVTFTVPVDFDHHGPMGQSSDVNVPVTTFTQRARFHQGFFVAEPQGEVLFRVNDRMAINVAAGYRAIAGTRGLDNQLRGPVGSLGVRFGV